MKTFFAQQGTTQGSQSSPLQLEGGAPRRLTRAKASPVATPVARALRARSCASPATFTAACPCAERTGHLVVSSSHLQPAGAQRRRCGGFTLLELLIVITMMIFITTIALVNYFGVMRAAGYATISNNVFNSLLMARQRACIDNKPVFFYLLDTTNYVLQESIGTITDIDGALETDTPPGGGVVFRDRYGSPPVQSNSVIVNMDNPAEPAATVWKVEERDLQHRFVIHVLLTSSAGWNDNGRNNDHYGTELFARQMLPKGFSFQQSPGTKVIFQPDGTVDIINGLKKLVVQEILGNNNTARQVTFTIESSGKITQGQ